MKKSRKKNIDGLLRCAASKRKDTEDKVSAAIEKLKRSKSRSINFKTVSEISGVSTTTLYNHSGIRERINSLRGLKKCSNGLMKQETLPAADSTIIRLREEILQLKEEKRMLVQQLVEMESLRAENGRLTTILSKLKSG